MRDSTVTEHDGQFLLSQGRYGLLTVHGKPLTVIPTHVFADEILVVLIGSLDVADLIGFVQKVPATLQSVPVCVSSDHNGILETVIKDIPKLLQISRPLGVRRER
jgi:hypothetical protein